MERFTPQTLIDLYALLSKEDKTSFWRLLGQLATSDHLLALQKEMSLLEKGRYSGAMSERFIKELYPVLLSAGERQQYRACPCGRVFTARPRRLMVSASRRVITGVFDKREICMSHVERHNLSIRTFMRRFTRLALGFSKKLENLAAATALCIAHYNYCRIHGSLRMTPAMRARIAGHPWTLEELLEAAEST